MNFSGFITSLIAIVALSAPLSAVTLDIAIRHTVQGEPMLLDSLRYQNGSGETMSFSRLSYLLSGFAIERDDGVWFDVPASIAWIDAASRRSTYRLENLQPGNYRALRFHVGPDAAANNADPSIYPADHPLNPNLNGLHWSWQGGYIFMAIEGYFRTGNARPKGYAYHLARDPNRTRVSLAAPLNLSRDAGLLLDFDLGVLLNAPRRLSLERDGNATHSRDGDPIAAALVANLPGAFRVARLLDTASTTIQPPAPVKPLYLPEKFTPYRFTMSGTFPVPDLPRDNPLIEERVALGKKLFHEPALSRDLSLSCASCHDAKAAFADSRRVSLGIQDRPGTRNAMPLFNLAWKSSFFWDGRVNSLREQVLMPIQDHAEMDETLDRVTAKLAADPTYLPRFTAAFGAPKITSEKIGLAIEQYLLTLTSFDSKFDRALRGKTMLDADEKRGFELFMTEYEPRTGQLGGDCFHCHGGPLFSDHQFHNNGLKPSKDVGRLGITGLESDRGKFATPSLRNISRTAPYMHDGQFATLEEVVAHYNHGIHRSPSLDPNLAKHPEGGLQLSPDDQRALVAFLKTLTEQAGQ